jgi:hypothetical protein
MRNLTFIFAVAIALFFGLNAKAQTADYFPGKWNVVIMGTPNGDAKLTFVLERKDGKLGGVVQDTTGKEMTKITQIDAMEPVDDDHVKGSLMGMFEAKGIRIKENH